MSQATVASEPHSVVAPGIVDQRPGIRDQGKKITSTPDPRPPASDRQASLGPPYQGQLSAATRRYIYCIIDCPEPTTSGAGDHGSGKEDHPDPRPPTPGFGPMGVGNDAEVFAITHEGIAAVVSSTATEKFEISRANTLAHQRVLEAVLQRGHTVLPVRFDTLAEDKPDGPAGGSAGTDAESRIVNHVLVQRRDEFNGLLALYRDRVELGVKGLWVDINAVFADIVNENAEIRLLRKRALDGAPSRGLRAAPVRKRPSSAINRSLTVPALNMPLPARLGELVKKALDAKKSAAEAELLNHLAGTILGACKNKTFGDPMFANLALLVNKSRQDDLAAALSAFEDQQAGRVRLKLVGPMPPFNFIELVITWDD